MGESSTTLSYLDLDQLTLEEQLQMAVYNSTMRTRMNGLTLDNLRWQELEQRTFCVSKGYVPGDV